MPLTTCPDCQSQVSTAAKSCPKCGCPIAERMRPAEPTVGDLVKGTAKTAWSIPLAVVAAPFALFSVWLMIRMILESIDSFARYGAFGGPDVSPWVTPASLALTLLATAAVAAIWAYKKNKH